MSEIKFDTHNLEALVSELRKLPETLQAQVMKRSLLRTSDAMATAAKRSISSHFNIKQGDIAKSLTKLYAGAGQAGIRAASPHFGFGKFDLRPDRDSRGLATYKIHDARQQVPFHSEADGATMFYAMMASGHMGLFSRTGQPSVSNPKLEQIKEQMQIGSAEMLEQRQVREEVFKKGYSTFVSEFRRQWFLQSQKTFQHK
jgi:hypothetical protein